MPFAFGDIYYVEFDPSVGREYRGTRPGMVVQEESISKTSPLVTVVPLTSKLNQLQPSDVFLQKDELNRLDADSVIKPKNIQSFDKQRFLFKIGRAGSPTVRSVRGYLRRHFGL
jgi:mRNA-degrading endonuclease toxin of MazEF toxin-antitoxin module